MNAAIILRESALFDFSEDVTEWLRKHNWHEDRRIEVPAWIPSGHPAESILASFGGLVLLRPDDEFPDDPIVEIEFQLLPPNDKVVNTWSNLLRSTVVGIGYGHSHHEKLYVDSRGRLYAASLMHDAFYLRGISLADSLHNLLIDARAKPMLRPDQRSVRLYGQEFTRNSPEVFRYEDAK